MRVTEGLIKAGCSATIPAPTEGGISQWEIMKMKHLQIGLFNYFVYLCS